MVIGNQLNPLLNIHALDSFSKNSTPSKTLGERVRSFIEKTDKNKVKFYYEDTKDFKTLEEFRRLLTASPQFSSQTKTPQNLAAALQESDVVILQNNVFEVLSKLSQKAKSLFLKLDKTSLQKMSKTQFSKYYSEIKEQFYSELKLFQEEHRKLLEKIRQLAPKAGVVVLAAPFLQEEIFSLILSRLLQSFSIKESNSFVKQAHQDFNKLLRENAKKVDASFLSFDSRNIFSVKKGLLDSLLSFFSPEVQEHSLDVFAKLIFLKLSAPERFFSNFKKYFKTTTQEEDLEQKSSFLDDFSNWLGVNFAEESNNTEYYKHFYFSQEQEQFIQRQISATDPLKNLNLGKTSRTTVRSYLKQLFSMFFSERQIDSLISKYPQVVQNIEDVAVFAHDTLVRNQTTVNFLNLNTFFSLVLSFASNFAKELTVQQKERIFSLFSKVLTAIIEDFQKDFNKQESLLEQVRALSVKYTKLVKEALSTLAEIAEPLLKTINSVLTKPLKVEDFKKGLSLIEEAISKIDIEELVREVGESFK